MLLGANWGATRESRDVQGKIGWTSSDEIWRTQTSPGMKPKNWRQTEQNGVNVWPNASIWMRDELRSKVMATLTLHHGLYEYVSFLSVCAYSRCTFFQRHHLMVDDIQLCNVLLLPGMTDHTITALWSYICLPNKTVDFSGNFRNNVHIYDVIMNQMNRIKIMIFVMLAVWQIYE